MNYDSSPKQSTTKRKNNAYRRKRRMSAASLANLKKGPAKRGFRLALSHDERCRFTFTVFLHPDDGSSLANRWILSTHGVNPSTCATHTHHPRIDPSLLPNYIGNMQQEERKLARQCLQLRFTAASTAALLSLRNALGLTFTHKQIAYMNDKEHKQMLDLNPDASTAEKLIATFEKRNGVLPPHTIKSIKVWIIKHLQKSESLWVNYIRLFVPTMNMRTTSIAEALHWSMKSGYDGVCSGNKTEVSASKMMDKAARKAKEIAIHNAGQIIRKQKWTQMSTANHLTDYCQAMADIQWD
jgi:hypothetical protein